MTTTLRSKIQAELAWTWTDHVDTLPIVDSNRLRMSVDLPDGDAEGQADAVWHASAESLAADQSTVYELDQLPQDLFGTTVSIAMAKVKAMLIANTSTTSGGYLLVGGAPGDAWKEPFGAAGEQIKIPPGGCLLLINPESGWDVTAGATDLKIAAAATAATFDMAILGVLDA